MLEENVKREEQLLVSVVVPALNAAAYIGDTLRSVCEQTCANWEVIVVDDGSTDETAKIVEEFAREDRRIRLLRQKASGVSAARNRGVSVARGEFVAPLDADDVWLPDNLELKLKRFETASAKTGLVYSWSLVVDEDGRSTGERVVSEKEGNVYPELLRGNFIGNGSAALIRRECFDRCQYSTLFRRPTAQGCEDWDLYLQVAREWEIAVVPSVTLLYRRTPGSISSRSRTMRRSYQLLLERHGRPQSGLTERQLRTAYVEFHLYLAEESFRWGRYWEPNICLLLALVASPGNLMRRRGICRLWSRYLAPRRVRKDRPGTESAITPEA